MTTVFIAGSMNIKNLDPKVLERIDNIVGSNFDVIVGDANGVDTSIQNYLFNRGSSRTVVYCSGSAPRNNVGKWPIRLVPTSHSEGSRAFFTVKDLAMAEAADFGLMIWDTKSTGTLNNIIELLAKKKKSLVFVNKDKEFRNISSVEQLEALIARMSAQSIRKADEKIRLSDRINALKHQQAELFA